MDYCRCRCISTFSPAQYVYSSYLVGLIVSFIPTLKFIIKCMIISHCNTVVLAPSTKGNICGTTFKEYITFKCCTWSLLQDFQSFTSKISELFVTFDTYLYGLSLELKTPGIYAQFVIP